MATVFAAAALSAGELPETAQYDIEYARELCRAVGKRFEYDYEYVEVTALNQDGQPDYIIDGRGFDCNEFTDQLFGDVAGAPLYIYLSQPGGGYERVLSAYVYEYLYHDGDGVRTPSVDLWLRGDLGYQTNRMRYQWLDGEFQVIDQEYGVSVPKQLWKQFD